MHDIHAANQVIKSVENTAPWRGWTSYNARYHFGTKAAGNGIFDKLQHAHKLVKNAIHAAPLALSEVFGRDTVQEIIESIIEPALKRAESWVEIGKNLTSRSYVKGRPYPSWQSRPIHQSGQNFGHLGGDL